MNLPSIPHARSILTDVRGVAMHAVVLGEEAASEAPNFVLVPGMGLSGRYMMPTAELLAAFGKVWVPDLPGCGKSGKPQSALDISELADALAAWLLIHQLGTPVLIGNSLGAQVIVDFATRYPQQLERAVLVAPTIDPTARRVASQVARLLADGLCEPLALYGIALTDYLRAGFGRVLQTLRYALADPVELKLPLLTCPVLVIRGGRDPIVPQHWVERVVSLIPRGRLVVVPHAAHAVNFNAPEDLVEEVLKFMELEGD